MNFGLGAASMAWRQGRSHEHAVAAIGARRRPGTCHIDGAAPGAIDAPTKKTNGTPRNTLFRRHRGSGALLSTYVAAKLLRS